MSDNLFLDFDRVINDKSLMALVRFTYMTIKSRKMSYMTPGEFFSGLSDFDLRALLEMVEFIENEKNNKSPDLDKATENLILLSMCLILAEGSLDTSGENLYVSVEKTANFAALESLARKGVIELDRSRMSYADTQECANLKVE